MSSSKKTAGRILIFILIGAALGAIPGFISGTYNMPMLVTIGVPIFISVGGFVYLQTRKAEKK
jgi:hypothetical protein